MIGMEKTQDAVGDALRNSYDRYAMAAQFRNAVIREQLQAMQDFVAISDKLLRLPFPGLMATDRSNETYKDLAIEMQHVIAEHSNSTLEIWASLFGYQGSKAAKPVAAVPAEDRKPAPPAETKAESKPKAKAGAKPAPKPKLVSKPKPKASGKKAASGSAPGDS